MLMHQMRISTISASSEMLRLNNSGIQNCPIIYPWKSDTESCEIEHNPSKDRCIYEGENTK
jgi:hypothetical protein